MGGNATKQFNTEPIPKELVRETIKTFSELSNIPLKDLVVVGSAGKKPRSNDIDLAVDKTIHPIDKVHALTSFKLSTNAVLMTGLGIGSYAVPVGKKKYQVDLMFTSKSAEYLSEMITSALFFEFVNPIVKSSKLTLLLISTSKSLK